MPAYDFRCPTCDLVFECRLPMSQSGVSQPCPGCGDPETTRLIGLPGMVFAGDGWATKDLRVDGQMTRKNAALEIRQRERYGKGLQVAPNVDGERTNTWAEAKKLAASKGYSPASYDGMIRKENAPS